jgi:hypothetical protein
VTSLVAASPSGCKLIHEALLEADTFEDLPGTWQAAILKAEQSRPELRVVTGD